MNYLFYIILVLALSVIFLIPLRFRYRLKKDFTLKIAIQKILQNQPPFFSTEILKKAVSIGLKHQYTPILDFLRQGKISMAVKEIKKYNPHVACLLNSLKNPQTTINTLTKKLKKTPADSQNMAWLALLLKNQTENDKMQAAWDNVNEKKISPYLRAGYWVHMADSALKNGDLEYASRLLYQAVTLYHQEQAYYEEGNLYLKLGTIYRICFVDDTAETLFRKGVQIFQQLKFEQGIADGYANLGMLLTGEERFSEAEDYLQKACEMCKNQLQKKAEIQNQVALLFLVQKQMQSTLNILKEAQKNHRQVKNTQGEAFTLELKANCYWQKEEYTQTIKWAQKAAELYKQNQNVSGLLESLYLQAQALFKQGDDTLSEKILREIIMQGKKDSGCFYLANAYNLLGIIYMKRKDLLRAKGLFRQSLELEQRGVRTKALAADYANLGLVEFWCGHQEDAKKNIQIALDFATQIEDDELYTQLEHHLKYINKKAQ